MNNLSLDDIMKIKKGEKMEKLEKIMQYEQQIAYIKNEINKLIKESDNNGNSIISTKIKGINQELENLQQQLNILENNNFNREKEQTKPPVISSIIPKECNGEKIYEFDNNHIISAIIPKESIKKEENKKNNIEEFIGKNMMGIAASILIFISLILFSTLVFPLLGDIVKMLLLFVFSTFLTVFGLLKLKNNLENKLFISLTACGLGSIYISLFISYIYFKTISDIPLYILLMCWAIFVCYLSRLRTIVFQIIGQIGIVISMFFGVVSSIDDLDKFLLVIVYFLIAEIIYNISFYNKGYRYLAINNISVLIVSFVYFVAYFIKTLFSSSSDILLDISSLIISAIIVLTVMLNYLRLSKKQLADIFMLITSTLYLLFIRCITYDLVGCLIVISLSLSILFFNNLRNKNIWIYLSDIIMLIYILTSFSDGWIYKYIYILPFAILFIIFGFIKKKREFIIYSIGYMACIVLNADMLLICRIIYPLILLGIIIAMMIKKNSCHWIIKNALYLFSLEYVFFIIPEILDKFKLSDFNLNLTFIVMIIIHLGYRFVISTKAKEKYSKIIFYIVNTCFMAASLVLINNAENIFLHFIIIILSFAIYSFNFSNLLNRKNIFWSFFAGGKFFILMITVLTSFEAPSIFISIASIIFAIISIYYGFIASYKYLRIFGLILSIFSVIKLILIDISYDDTIWRALSFFICGILCFVISVIYNKIDKKIESNQ